MTKDELLQILDSWENILLLEKLPDEAQFQLYPLLMDVALYGDDLRGWRAAWMAEKINIKNPKLSGAWVEKVTESLTGLKNSSKKRHFLKLLSEHPVTAENRAFLIGYCLNLFDEIHEPPAVIVHGMQLLYNISEDEPAFKPELLELMQYLLEVHESAGVLARARKLRQKLIREI